MSPPFSRQSDEIMPRGMALLREARDAAQLHYQRTISDNEERENSESNESLAQNRR
jgi:hypothetical protein